MKQAKTTIGGVQHQDTILSAVKRTEIGTNGALVVRFSNENQNLESAIRGTFPGASITHNKGRGLVATLTGGEALRFGEGYAHYIAPQGDPSLVSHTQAASLNRLNDNTTELFI